MPGGMPTMKPYQPTTPVGSGEFPMADFSGIGRMPQMNFENPNTALILERGTNPRSSLANSGAFAAYITDAGRRAGQLAPSRGELMMKALRMMEQGKFQQPQAGPSPTTPIQAPQEFGQKPFGTWIAENYPHLSRKAVGVPVYERLKQEWLASQQADLKTYDANLERYRSMLMQKQLEQQREIALARQRETPMDQLKVIAQLAKVIEEDPKTFEAMLTKMASRGQMHPEQAMRRGAQFKRESTRPPVQKKPTPPKTVSEFYARQMAEATDPGTRDTAEENYFEALSKEAKRRRDDTVSMSEQLADALQKAAKTIPDTGKPDPQAMKLVNFYIQQIGKKSAEERGKPQESDAAIVRALTNLVTTLLRGMDQGLDRDTTAIEIQQLLFQAKKQAAKMTTGRTVDEILRKYGNDWDAIWNAYYEEHQKAEADPSFQVTITDDILREIGAQIKGGE